MKIYNQITDKIEELPKEINDNGIVKLSKILSDEDKIRLGYCPIKYLPKPDQRYYTYTENKEIVENIYTISYIPVERDLDIVKKEMIQRLSDSFKKVTKRPKVPTSLGFTVDGGREDLQNFELGKKYQIESVVDAGDQVHTISPETDYDTIITEIELYGINLWQKKQLKKQTIMGFTTIQECIDYEHYEYEEEVDVLDENGEPTGETKIVTKYKSLIDEW